jgi:ABC-type multidrug transport system fused ATPase/permease subunit
MCLSCCARAQKSITPACSVPHEPGRLTPRRAAARAAQVCNRALRRRRLLHRLDGIHGRLLAAGLAETRSLCALAFRWTLAFWRSWRVALVILGIAPVLFSSIAILFRTSKASAKRIHDAYAAAGGVASEALVQIRAVAALGLEAETIRRYEAHGGARRAARRAERRLVQHRAAGRHRHQHSLWRARPQAGSSFVFACYVLACRLTVCMHGCLAS